MKHLNDASEDYVNHHDGKIRPISNIDGEIIKEIIQILDLRGGNKDLVSIMKKWKKDQDGQVLDQLVQYGLTLDDETGEASGEKGSSKKAKQLIQVEDVMLDVRGMMVVLSSDYWSGSEGCRVYSIKINPENMVAPSVMYRNVEIVSISEDYRDKLLEKVKRELENNTNVEFYKA
jgi:hypothetical protein